jgi:hypothetical protein
MTGKLIIVVGSQLDIIEEDPALTGNRPLLGNQAPIVVFTADLKDPFLFGFFSLDQTDHSPDRDCQEYCHFVFNSFHGYLF